MIITESSDVNKILLHISTFGIRLPNITKITIFTELVHKKFSEKLQIKGIIDNIANKQSFFLQIAETPKFDEKTEEYVHIKNQFIQMIELPLTLCFIYLMMNQKSLTVL